MQFLWIYLGVGAMGCSQPTSDGSETSGTAPPTVNLQRGAGSGSGSAEVQQPVGADDPWARSEAVQREVDRMTPVALAEKAVAETEASARIAKAEWISLSLRTRSNLEVARFRKEEIEGVLARDPKVTKRKSDWMLEMEIAGAARADLERLRAEEGSGAKSLPNGATNP